VSVLFFLGCSLELCVCEDFSLLFLFLGLSVRWGWGEMRERERRKRDDLSSENQRLVMSLLVCGML
jgi:hypothetical protein